MLTLSPTLTDEWEEMCIVGVSERVASALASQPFQRLLAALELQPPNDQVRKLMSPKEVACLILTLGVEVSVK